MARHTQMTTLPLTLFFPTSEQDSHAARQPPRCSSLTCRSPACLAARAGRAVLILTLGYISSNHMLPLPPITKSTRLQGSNKPPSPSYAYATNEQTTLLCLAPTEGDRTNQSQGLCPWRSYGRENKKASLSAETQASTLWACSVQTCLLVAAAAAAAA